MLHGDVHIPGLKSKSLHDSYTITVTVKVVHQVTLFVVNVLVSTCERRVTSLYGLLHHQKKVFRLDPLHRWEFEYLVRKGWVRSVGHSVNSPSVDLPKGVTVRSTRDFVITLFDRYSTVK